MKKIVVGVFSLFAFIGTAGAANWVPYDGDNDNARNFYDTESIQYQGNDRTVTVLNNAGKSDKVAKSAVSEILVDCRLGTFQVLSWTTFPELMGKGTKVKSNSKPSQVIFIMAGSPEFELKKKICV